jgi:hypothetical protein
MSGTYPTGWNDSAYAISAGNGVQTLRPVHQFVGNVYYGNGDLLGALLDAGSGTVSHLSNVLDFPTREEVTDVSDDGLYLAIATTENAASQSTFARNYVSFWDTFSSSWNRRHVIRDPFIWALENIGGVVYAFGQQGIYEVTFSGGARKILSRTIGFGTSSDVAAGYGSSRATVYGGSALMFATDTTVDTFGKLSPDVPNAYFKNFKIPSGVGTPTFISADLDAGRVYVATDGAKLYGYDFNNTTRDTGVTAQTVYFPVSNKVLIKRIELVFGEPLSTGESYSAGIFRDEDTAVTTFGTVSHTVNGAIRRKILLPTIRPICENQFSILFTPGAKLKRIEVYADPMSV